MVVTSINSQEIIRSARAKLGVRYIEHGRNPRSGLDCAGLISIIAREHYLPFPHDPCDYDRACRLGYVRDQLGRNMIHVPNHFAKRGMVVLIQPRTSAVHLGILDSMGTMIVASNEPEKMKVVREVVDWTTVRDVYAYRGVDY